jgi:aerobic carbon-monoxide dehydrogenase large subunit
VSAGYVGRSVPRVEDRPLLMGRGSFVDDIHRTGELVARIVRSEAAHGRITSIATTDALRRPGVEAIVTAADVPDVRIPVRMMPSDEAVPVTQPVIARDVVRYVGEPLAVVVATDPYVAEDAASEVEVEIAELDPVTDPFTAALPACPPLHEAAVAGNVVNTLRAAGGGDAQALLRAAETVVRERLRVQRHAAIPLETRGLVAEFDARERRLTIWGPTKVKHFNRALLAGFLGMPEESIRLVEPDVGGGFGARGEFYPEDFLVPWLAIRLGRPVRWIEDRREHFVAINHSRETWCDMEVGATRDGRLLAFRARCVVDQGSYARTHGTVLVPHILVRHLAGPYLWGGFAIEASSVLTNKTPFGTYRGPGQFEAAYFRERMLDRLAAELGHDPAELRARNLVPLEAMPHRIELGGSNQTVVYDGGDFPRVVDTLRARVSYAELRASQARRRECGELVGVGLCCYVEEASFGRYEYARIAPRDGGGWVAHVGIASLGQGVRTALAQIAADELRVPVDEVEISHRDTELVPEGFGAYASRTTVIGGGAVLGAAADLRTKAFAAASERLEIAVGDLELGEGGVIRPRGNPALGIPLEELADEGRCRFEKPLPSFDMGACLALVSVDPETGGVSIRRIVICHDVGRAVNPQLVDGQLVGAAIQGVGGILLEELPYDAQGQPLATSFMDYLVPTAAESPAVDALALELPHHDAATEHPLRVKAAGEGGVIGAGAAVANAVADAVRGQVLRLPLRPDNVLSLIDQGREAVDHPIRSAA